MGIFSFFSSNPTEKQFAKLATVALRQNNCEFEFRLNEPDFSIEFLVNDEWSQHWYLRNAYKQYCASYGKEKKQILHQFAQSVLSMAAQELPESYSEAQSRIYPGIREPEEWEYLRLLSELGGNSLLPSARQAISPCLYKTLIFDYKDSMAIVGKDTLAKWEIDFDEAFAQAQDNLRKVSYQPFESLKPGLYISQWQDDYDASRIFLPELFHRLELLGDPVITLPTRNTILVTGSKDAQGIEDLAEITRKALDEEPKVITGYALTLNNFTLEHFPQQQDEISKPLYNLNQYWKSRNYEAQKHILCSYLYQKQADIFTASCLLSTNDETGFYETLSVVTKDVDTLLPRADTLVFFDPLTDEKIVTNWSTAFRNIPHLFETTDFTPLRYRFRRYPDPTELDLLRKISVIC
ncbi:MAG: hypothetical protein OEZ68_00855 [Gammaproteobacteria bacterium]|nr:hypothetical protein [Gammaproteobacteria bacterium]MDH5799328.1 hypothetical protein [Gammaproteobacteria bacterium]